MPAMPAMPAIVNALTRRDGGLRARGGDIFEIDTYCVGQIRRNPIIDCGAHLLSRQFFDLTPD